MWGNIITLLKSIELFWNLNQMHADQNKIIMYHKKYIYFGKELSYELQLYCPIITMRLSSICVTKWKAGLFSRKYQCGRIYKMTAESKTSSLVLSPEATRDCGTQTVFSLCCLGSLWCLHEQLAIKAGSVPNANFQLCVLTFYLFTISSSFSTRTCLLQKSMKCHTAAILIFLLLC